MTPNEYIHGQGKPFERMPRIGRLCINVLPELYGKPWDEVALGYIHALRPSTLRIRRNGECETVTAAFGE